MLKRIFLFFISELQTFSFLFQNENIFTKNGLLAEEDLHIYIIDPNNQMQSITILEQEMEKRTRKDKEFWFIDISTLETIENVKIMLNNLLLDIDDDVYIFKFSNNTFVDIWEIYKFLPKNDLIVKKLGIWKPETGLFSTTLSKWQRRKDLTVSFAKSIISHFFFFCNSSK